MNINDKLTIFIVFRNFVLIIYRVSTPRQIVNKNEMRTMVLVTAHRVFSIPFECEQMGKK